MSYLFIIIICANGDYVFGRVGFLSVCLSVCLFVSRIIHKVIKEYVWNSYHRSVAGHCTTRYILGMILITIRIQDPAYDPDARRRFAVKFPK